MFALIGESRFTGEDSPRLCTHACTVERVVPVVDRRLTTSSFTVANATLENPLPQRRFASFTFEQKLFCIYTRWWGNVFRYLGSKIWNKRGEGNKLFSISNCRLNVDCTLDFCEINGFSYNLDFFVVMQLFLFWKIFIIIQFDKSTIECLLSYVIWNNRFSFPRN